MTARPVASSPVTSLREQHTEAQPLTPAAPAFPAATDALLASAAGGPAAPAQAPQHLEEPAADEFATPVLAPIAVHACEDADAPMTPSVPSHTGAGMVPGSVSCLLLHPLTEPASSAHLLMSCSCAGGRACKGPCFCYAVPACPLDITHCAAEACALPRLLQTSQENAQILSGWTGGEEVVSELFAYLSTLGVEGAGLVEATASAPIVGHIVGGSCPAMGALPCTAVVCISGHDPRHRLWVPARC